MLINKNYIREHITLISIILFVFMFGLIVMIKPAFLYNKDGSVREFGIGYKNKTVVPIWFFAMILAILVYVGVNYIFDYRAGVEYY